MKYLLPLLLLSLMFAPSLAFAQTPSFAATSSASPTPSVQSVDYTLPYHGLLPDSPLYFLKALRDHVIGFLISDPLKKAQFDLLQANKRLEAGVYLVKTEGTGKDALAEQTISKGYNYFDEALTKLKEAKLQGKDVTSTAQEISLATQKHVEVLTDLSTDVKPSDVSKFTALITRVQAYGVRAEQFTKK